MKSMEILTLVFTVLTLILGACDTDNGIDTTNVIQNTEKPSRDKLFMNADGSVHKDDITINYSDDGINLKKVIAEQNVDYSTLFNKERPFDHLKKMISMHQIKIN